MKRAHLATIGSFDGVHRGHQELIKRTVAEAKKRKLRSLALTFQVPPRMILNPKAPRILLSSPTEKELLLRSFGIDEVISLDFDTKLAALKPFSFFRSVLLNEFNARGIVVGLDFRFGAERAGGALELVRWGLEFELPVWVIPPVRHAGQVVSSSLIRGLFAEGRYQKAEGFLGHPYLIHGKAVHGHGVGRTIGFPTVNLEVEPGKVLPGGVYAVRAWAGSDKLGRKTFEGVCNIGTRPTFGGHKVITEIHFLGKAGVPKEKTVFVQLLRRLRSEKKFRSPSALSAQIALDAAKARAFFR